MARTASTPLTIAPWGKHNQALASLVHPRIGITQSRRTATIWWSSAPTAPKQGTVPFWVTQDAAAWSPPHFYPSYNHSISL